MGKNCVHIPAREKQKTGKEPGQTYRLWQPNYRACQLSSPYSKYLAFLHQSTTRRAESGVHSAPRRSLRPRSCVSCGRRRRFVRGRQDAARKSIRGPAMLPPGGWQPPPCVNRFSEMRARDLARVGTCIARDRLCASGWSIPWRCGRRYATRSRSKRTSAKVNGTAASSPAGYTV